MSSGKHRRVAGSARVCAPAVGGASARSLPIFILGGGSNVLVGDDGFRGFVIKIEISGNCLGRKDAPDVCRLSTSGACLCLRKLGCVRRRRLRADFGAWKTCRVFRGIVGGAPVQNIGAYGSEVKNVIEWVEAVDMRTGAPRKMLPRNAEFGYRDSIFKKKEGKIIL